MATIIPVANTWSFSPFSGIVAEARLGAFPVSLALDFASSDSFVYPSTNCPEFLSGCYSTPGSGAELSDSSDEDVLYSDTLKLDGFFDINSLRFALTGVPDSEDLEEVKFLDVHGRIGAGPSSTLFSGKAVEIKDNSEGLSVHSVDPGNEWGLLLDPVQGDEWTVKGTVRIDDEIFGNFGMIVIDPGESDLVIPAKMWGDMQEIDDNYTFDEEGRVFAPCSSTGELVDFMDIELEVYTKTGVNIPIRLGSRLFEFPNPEIRSFDEDGESIASCAIRMRVARNEHAHLTIGRILLRSVDRLRFNYNPGNPQVSLVPRIDASGLSERFDDPLPRIPLFESPVLLNHNGYMHISIPRGNSGRLVLLSLTPEMSGLTECWYLLRRHAKLFGTALQTLPNSWVVGGSATFGLKVSLDGESLEFQLNNLGIMPGKLTIRHDFDRISICTDRSVSLVPE